MHLKLPCTFTPTIFLEILIFRLMYRSKHDLSSKKILKNIKYWQRNGGFEFCQEVKITRLIDIFSVVFCNQFFSLEAYTVKKLKLIVNLSDCLQILTVSRLTHEQQNYIAIFFLSKYFYSESDYCTTLHIFKILFQKCSVTFHWY